MVLRFPTPPGNAALILGKTLQFCTFESAFFTGAEVVHQQQTQQRKDAATIQNAITEQRLIWREGVRQMHPKNHKHCYGLHSANLTKEYAYPRRVIIITRSTNGKTDRPGDDCESTENNAGNVQTQTRAASLSSAARTTSC